MKKFVLMISVIAAALAAAPAAYAQGAGQTKPNNDGSCPPGLAKKGDYCETPSGQVPGNPPPGPGGNPNNPPRGQARSSACVPTKLIKSASAQPSGRRLRLAFSATAPVSIDLYHQSAGTRVLGERLVARFRDAKGSTSWNGRDRKGRALPDGIYVVRFTARRSDGISEGRRIPLARSNGRFRVLPAYADRDGCGIVRTFKLERPVFGGATNRALNLSFKLGEQATATVEVRRGQRVVKTFSSQTYAADRLHRLRVSVKPSSFPRGRYTVVLTVRDAAGRVTTRTLSAQRI